MSTDAAREAHRRTHKNRVGLADFVELAEDRLYRALIIEAEKYLARIEKGDIYVASDAAMTVHKLLMAARELKAAP